jgi:hypothetical protein
MAIKPINPAPPNLPYAPDEYSTNYQEKLTNVLRLFFNQLNDVLTTLITSYITNTSITTVAKLPTASMTNAGTRTFVSDATVTTFGSTVVGGGTNIVPIYSTGTSWKIG